MDDPGKTDVCNVSNEGFKKRREFFGCEVTEGDPKVTTFRYYTEAINFQVIIIIKTLIM